MASSVAAQFSRKLDRAAAELKRSQRTALVKGLTELKQGVDKRLPASKRLRGVGKNGARVGVRYDVLTDGSGVVKATGPLHLLERDTKAHTVEPKSKGRGANRKKRSGALKLPDGNFRGAAQHPGTKGQHPFEKGIAAGRAPALKAMANPISDAVKRGLRG